jgi:hypothetical protein
MWRTKKIGISLLGIWLIATGALHLIPNPAFAGSGNLLALVAILAGILILLDR